MSAQENKAVIRRYFEEARTKGNPDVVDKSRQRVHSPYALRFRSSARQKRRSA